MLVTGQNTNIQCKMNDDSVFSLASYSKLVIDRAIYNPDEQKRDSLIRLMFGKARYIITKLMLKKDDFKIRTRTAVVGIRGSDFALSVVPEEEATVKGLGFDNR